MGLSSHLPISAHVAPCWCMKNFFFNLMHPIGPELPISAHVACAPVCRQLYVLCASHALVQATVGGGTVIFVYIGVAYTRGGGGNLGLLCSFYKRGGQTVKRPPQQPAHPQYANYWAPLTRKRHIPPHPAQPQHTNYWAPRTRKRHQQEHRPQRPTESSDPTQHAKGRTGDCPGPRKGATTRRNVTQGAYCGGCQADYGG